SKPPRQAPGAGEAAGQGGGAEGGQGLAAEFACGGSEERGGCLAPRQGGDGAETGQGGPTVRPPLLLGRLHPGGRSELNKVHFAGGMGHAPRGPGFAPRVSWVGQPPGVGGG